MKWWRRLPTLTRCWLEQRPASLTSFSWIGTSAIDLWRNSSRRCTRSKAGQATEPEDEGDISTGRFGDFGSEEEFEDKFITPLVKRWGRNGPFIGCTKYPECRYTLNIGPDGSLDYDEEFRREFEWNVASVHSHFDLSAEEQTVRLIKAISDPTVNAIGHVSGRYIGRRPGIEFDVDSVIEALRIADVGLEVNGALERLDADELMRALAKPYPDSALAHYAVATMALQSGDLEHARERAERAIELEPDNLKLKLLYGRVLLTSGDIDAAIDYTARLVGDDMDPDPDARIELAIMYMMADMPDYALSQVNQVLLERPNNTSALRLMAIINFRLENLDAAVDGRERLDPLRRMLLEVAHREETAVRLRVGDDGPGDLAAIERVASAVDLRLALLLVPTGFAFELRQARLQVTQLGFEERIFLLVGPLQLVLGPERIDRGHGGGFGGRFLRRQVQVETCQRGDEKRSDRCRAAAGWKYPHRIHERPSAAIGSALGRVK